MIVFDIKRYAINDGPGIRTTVFLKGCPLRCAWCHNPESWSAHPELLFKQKKCIGCNACGIHPHQSEYIGMTNGDTRDSSFQNCPTLALEMCGREWTLDELLNEIEKERDIMTDSGGGVTVSGGEPLMQCTTAFTRQEGAFTTADLLKALGQRGIHRAVDTTLFASSEVVRAVAEETDLFLVDLKVMDEEKHRRYTGVSNVRILDNLRLVTSLGVPFQIRIPLIEGINADEENIEATALYAEEILTGHAPSSGSDVALLPYHEMGRDKHARRGTTYNPDQLPMYTPDEATLKRCIQQFAAHGIKATVGG